MPELPEVETIRRGLNRFILNKKIVNVKILCDKSFIGPKELIEGQEIIAIRRFGKALVFDFKNQVSMLVHLRMTGQLIYRACGEESGKNYIEMIQAGDFKTSLYTEKSFAGGHPTDSFFSKLPNKQTRVLFEIGLVDNTNNLKDIAKNNNHKSQQNTTTRLSGLNNKKVYDKSQDKKQEESENFDNEKKTHSGSLEQKIESGTLYFNDQRKFGFCKIIETDEVLQDEFIKKLAKEPWQISVEEFKKNLLHHKNAEVKPTILDQTVIAGLGNIYADEALFLAKIHPERLVSTLTDHEIETLLESAKTVMQKSIDSGGSTMATYVKADGTRGDYLQKFAQVFRREGEPCNRCGTEIIKIKVAGRGTHLCPNCQKKF